MEPENERKHRSSLDMDVQFRLLGNGLKEFTDISDYTEVSDKSMVLAIRNAIQLNFAILKYNDRIPSTLRTRNKG